MRMRTRDRGVAYGLALVVVASMSVPDPVSADVLCTKKSGVVVRRAACKRKETALNLSQFGALGPMGAKGNPGDPGAQGPSGEVVYRFSGIVKNLPILSLTGWRQCYTDLYNNNATPLASVLAACPGANLLLGCRATGSGTLIVAANAPRTDVLFDTGTGNTLHDANGLGWYYNDNWSWGFAPSGATVDRGECDTIEGTDSDQRLCWHTNNAPNINFGYRCGATLSLNFSTEYERVIFEAPN